MLAHIACLNNANRLQILAMLKRAPMSADHIAGRFTIKKDSTMKNLHILEMNGMVRRTGMLYKANPFWLTLIEQIEKATKQ